MPVLPHNFPTLRHIGNAGHRPSVLMLGAGMSYGLVPGPDVLLAEKRASAEAKLGCVTNVPLMALPPANHLYQWADEIRTILIARGDPNPKLTLAQSLDIPSDPRWLGCVTTQRNTPRHRVIARFARERLWDQVWSLNWDCVQESAFENVGIKRDGTDHLMPWPNVFHTLVTAAECAQMGRTHVVRMVKPHGCVMALVTAQEAWNNGDGPHSVALSDRFLITSSELASLAPMPGMTGTQHFIFANLSTKLHTQPFIIAGWSASEPYLIDHIDVNVRPVLEERPIANDELSIIDIAFNNQGHTRLASFYGKNEHTAHVPVSPTGFDMDQLFLWLQSLYALDRLDPWVPIDDRVAFAELTAEIQQPPDVLLFVVKWVDNFLPVWVRLCWRCGFVECFDRNHQRVKTDDIPLESRDEHIPWELENIYRPELVVAARLLSALHRSGNAAKWDFEMFPGGLYQDNQLVIPLPAWDSAPPNNLRGLKPLIDAIKKLGVGYIGKLGVLPLGLNAGEVIPADRKQVLRELVATHLAMTGFIAAKIEEIELEDL